MRRDVELELLDRALKQIADKNSFPTSAYSSVSIDRYYSDEWFSQEKDKIFFQVPSMLIHGSQIAEPNCFVTLEHFGRSLIVCRNSNGEARAFLNVCRHRGARLESRESGRRKRFTCAYHAWSYDTDGCLKSIPSASCFPGITPGSRNLVPVNVVEAYGFVWLMPEHAPGMDDLDAFLGPIREDFAELGLDAYEVYGFESHEWEINWKLVVEGTLEGYHFPVLHPKSAHPLFENGCFLYDRLDPHLRSILPKRSINFIKRKDRSDWRLLAVANVIYTIFPNETILNQSDHFLWITPHPLSATRTLVKLRLIVPRSETGESQDDNWKANKELTYQVQYEDLEIYRAIQLGFASGANTEHCFGLQEAALKQFNDNIDTYMRADAGR